MGGGGRGVQGVDNITGGRAFQVMGAFQVTGERGDADDPLILK